MELSRAEFEDLVADALDQIPPELTRMMDNVVILVEDEAPPEDPHLLGCYDGVALTEREFTTVPLLPDRITIFRLPLQAICDTREELAEEVEITVVHEIAHHFGINDAALHELGYG